MSRFDELSAEQVIAHIDGLSQTDLAKVREYERGHQNRPAVLAGIAALAGDEPWPGYDALNEAALESPLAEASRERLNAVVTYERVHKNRTTVLQTAARHLVMSTDE